MTLSPVLTPPTTTRTREPRSPVVLSLAISALLMGLLGLVVNILAGMRLFAMLSPPITSALVWERTDAVCGAFVSGIVALACGDSLLRRPAARTSLIASAFGGLVWWGMCVAGNFLWTLPLVTTPRSLSFSGFVASASGLMVNPNEGIRIGHLLLTTLLAWGWVGIVFKLLARRKARPSPADEVPPEVSASPPPALEALSPVASSNPLQYQPLAVARRAAAPLGSLVAGRSVAKALCWLSLILAVLTGARYADVAYDAIENEFTNPIFRSRVNQAEVASRLFDRDLTRTVSVLFAPGITVACLTILAGAILALVGGPGGRTTLLVGLLLFSLATLFSFCLRELPIVLIVSKYGGAPLSRPDSLPWQLINLSAGFLRDQALTILCFIGLRNRAAA